MAMAKIEIKGFISTHVLRMEDDRGPLIVPLDTIISTHVLRMEDDNKRYGRSVTRTNFNPRPAHGGRHPRITVSSLIK